MMKFVVNQLPYYGELCPLWTMCSKNAKEHECPRYKDGTWTTVIREFEEDIPDLGREELICNKCGRPDYPKCKETVCEAWKYHKSKN